jgi:hypothetical protein
MGKQEAGQPSRGGDGPVAFGPALGDVTVAAGEASAITVLVVATTRRGLLSKKITKSLEDADPRREELLDASPHAENFFARSRSHATAMAAWSPAMVIPGIRPSI